MAWLKPNKMDPVEEVQGLCRGGLRSACTRKRDCLNTCAEGLCTSYFKIFKILLQWLPQRSIHQKAHQFADSMTVRQHEAQKHTNDSGSERFLGKTTRGCPEYSSGKLPCPPYLSAGEKMF